MGKPVDDRRTEERRPPDRYYSVQFKDPQAARFFQFKLWDVSDRGLCIIVPEHSEVLPGLAVGQIVEMSYYLSESYGTTETFRTEIRHISVPAAERLKGHRLVGLRILDA